MEDSIPNDCLLYDRNLDKIRFASTIFLVSAAISVCCRFCCFWCHYYYRCCCSLLLSLHLSMFSMLSMCICGERLPSSLLLSISHMNKYSIINAKIKLWTLSMWHIMPLMRCIILLNNIKWKMYTANRMLCSTKMQMHRQHAFDIDVCLLKCVSSAGRRACARSLARLYMCSRASALTSSLCFILNPTRDFDANFNKHYVCIRMEVCVCMSLKAFSVNTWNTHIL